MYRFNSIVFVILFSTLLFYSCDEVINPELEEASPVLVIDAWLNNAPGTQQIFITRSQPYFESVLPPGVSGATVRVSDENGKIYTFSESKPGVVSSMASARCAPTPLQNRPALRATTTSNWQCGYTAKLRPSSGRVRPK